MRFINHWWIEIVLFFLFSAGSCLRWRMEPNSFKCLRKELVKNKIVTGVYEVNKVQGQQINYVVKDSKYHILSQKEDISSGKFSFSIENYDVFEICFTSKITDKQINAVSQEIFVDIRIGTESNNFDVEARADKLKDSEMYLKHLQDLSKDIIIEFTKMNNRADSMENTNESTKKKVHYFSLISMICLISLAMWQVIYLRQYFKRMKLID